MAGVLTGCPYDCGGSCPLTVYVEDSEIKRIGPYEEPDSPERPQLRPCARGLSQVQRLYHPDRLRFPMKRVGERGEGRFHRISWDEALDTVAGRLGLAKEQVCRYCREAFRVWGEQLGLGYRPSPRGRRPLQPEGRARLAVAAGILNRYSPSP